jgi:hypothetical protein
MRADGNLDVTFDLTAADGKVCQQAFPGHPIPGKRNVIIYRDPRP